MDVERSDFMINGKFTLQWKITKVLDTAPPIHQDSIIFEPLENTRLYRQFGVPINLGYVPYVLKPQVVFHQVIKNKLAKQNINISDKKFPYNIYIPSLDSHLLLNIKIRLYPPNILSLTVTLSGIPNTLDTVDLIDCQKLVKRDPIKHIIEWTIGIVETFDHKNFNQSNGFHNKPILYLDIDCLPENFETHIKENISQYSGILIRNHDYEIMSQKIPDAILEKNEEHNLKSSKELLLLDKQGALYLKQIDITTPKSQKQQLSKIEDLYEIAIIFGEFLSNYSKIREKNEDLADTYLCKIRTLVDEPETAFKSSVEHQNMWKLLLSEFKLKAQMKSIMELKDKSDSSSAYSGKWMDKLSFVEKIVVIIVGILTIYLAFFN